MSTNISQINLPSSFNGFSFLGFYCCPLSSDIFYHLQLRASQRIFIQGCITFFLPYSLSFYFNLTLRRIVFITNFFLRRAKSCGLCSVTWFSPWLPFCSRLYAMIFSQSRANPIPVPLRTTKLIGICMKINHKLKLGL